MKLTILALALLLTAPLIGLAESSEEPALLASPTTSSYESAPLAPCGALLTTGALPVSSEQNSSVAVATQAACYYTIAYSCSSATGRACSVSDCPQYNTCNGTQVLCGSSRYVYCCT